MEVAFGVKNLPPSLPLAEPASYYNYTSTPPLPIVFPASGLRCKKIILLKMGAGIS